MEMSMPAEPPRSPGMPVEAEEACRLPEGFLYLDEALSGVFWDAKYAGPDNFTGAPVDGYESNRVACSEEMIGALRKARDLAAEKGWKLLIWDAARPQRAVDRFVEWSNEPEDGSTRAAHYPRLKKAELFAEGYIARRSGHSRGAAVDLTLLTQAGEALDMGGAFDLMDEKSHHGAKGLTRAQRENREKLRSLMETCGFKAYEREWWHYSLADEPFPGEYFDFVISAKGLRPLETRQGG